MNTPTRRLRSKKALLLDRDGVININHGYVHKPEDCDFVPGIFELCQSAQQKGYRIIVVTNQSGIARDYYSRQTFVRFTRWLEHQFWIRGISIEHTYHCPHHPKLSGPYGRTCCCRKPRPGMLFKARRDFGISLQRSIMVGDSVSDVRCARLAGVGKAVLLKPRRHGFLPKLEAEGKKPYYRASTLSAIKPLLSSGSDS